MSQKEQNVKAPDNHFPKKTKQQHKSYVAYFHKILIKHGQSCQKSKSTDKEKVASHL